MRPIGEPYSEVKPFPEMLSVVTDPNPAAFLYLGKVIEPRFAFPS